MAFIYNNITKKEMNKEMTKSKYKGENRGDFSIIFDQRKPIIALQFYENFISLQFCILYDDKYFKKWHFRSSRNFRGKINFKKFPEYLLKYFYI